MKQQNVIKTGWFPLAHQTICAKNFMNTTKVFNFQIKINQENTL